MQASSNGEMRSVGRTRLAGKGKERATEVKVSMKAKVEDLATRENNKRRGRSKAKTTERNRIWAEWRLTWGLGGSHPHAILDPEKEEEKGETRRMRWAGSEDDEGKVEDEQETGGERETEAEAEQEKEEETREETRQEESTGEKAPGSEQWEESKEKAREEVESSRGARKTGKREREREREERREEEGKVEAQEGHEGKEELTM